jgi:5-methylthioadenosine/S-adenosylhomocysteine deaminase
MTTRPPSRPSTARANGRVEVYIGIEWLPLAPRTAPGRPPARRRARHRHPHPPERIADRGGETPRSGSGARPTRWPTTPDPRPNCHRRALRVAVGRRDRADAGDRHPDLAQSVVATPSSGNGIARLPEILAPGSTSGSATTRRSATTAGTCSR